MTRPRPTRAYMSLKMGCSTTQMRYGWWEFWVTLSVVQGRKPVHDHDFTSLGEVYLLRHMITFAWYEPRIFSFLKTLVIQ
jgi:hypothetical protein